MERYELAKNRIMELETEIDGAFGDYIREAAHLFVTIFHVMDGTEYAKQRKEWTENLYEEIAGIIMKLRTQIRHIVLRNLEKRSDSICVGFMPDSAIVLSRRLKRMKKK